MKSLSDGRLVATNREIAVSVVRVDLIFRRFFLMFFCVMLIRCAISFALRDCVNVNVLLIAEFSCCGIFRSAPFSDLSKSFVPCIVICISSSRVRVCLANSIGNGDWHIRTVKTAVSVNLLNRADAGVDCQIVERMPQVVARDFSYHLCCHQVD